MRDPDPLHVGDRAAHLPDRSQDLKGVGVREGVHERKVLPVGDEEGADPAPRLVSHGHDSWREFHGRQSSSLTPVWEECFIGR